MFVISRDGRRAAVFVGLLVCLFDSKIVDGGNSTAVSMKLS